MSKLSVDLVFLLLFYDLFYREYRCRWKHIDKIGRMYFVD